jgi:predicted transcriptional regulator
MGEAMREFMARAVVFQDAIAHSVGVNGTDMQVVGLLMSQGPATPGELAARTGLTAGGSITAVVDRLERAGYVRRERDTEDRRRVIVHADTVKVMETVGPIYGQVGARWENYLDTLSQDQVEFAIELFTRAAEINREEVVRLHATSDPGE